MSEPKYHKITLKATSKAPVTLGLKKEGQKRFSKDHKFEYEEISGERTGGDGKSVFIHQIIDRVKNYYKKLVKQENKIIKDIKEKLTEHK